jgi:hypothetical protein
MTARELWDQHTTHDFPARLRGRDIGGIDFVMLDADVAGIGRPSISETEGRSIERQPKCLLTMAAT